MNIKVAKIQCIRNEFKAAIQSENKPQREATNNE